MLKVKIENLIRRAVEELQDQKKISKTNLPKIKIEHPREKNLSLIHI